MEVTLGACSSGESVPDHHYVRFDGANGSTIICRHSVTSGRVQLSCANSNDNRENISNIKIDCCPAVASDTSGGTLPTNPTHHTGTILQN